VPRVFDAILVTLIVVGGGSLARARAGFEWQGTLIERRINRNEIDPNATIPVGAEPWPRRPEAFWTVSLWAVLLSGAALVGGVWWWATAARSHLACSVFV
jgi:hypothetical protein